MIVTEESKALEKLQSLTCTQLLGMTIYLSLNNQVMPDITKVSPVESSALIIKLAKQIHGKNWQYAIDEAYKKIMTNTQVYFENKLEPIKDFLVDPPEPTIATQETKTVKELRKALQELNELKEPQLIKVSGTLFPAALLSAGWWEKARSKVNIEWKNKLQQWLFEGFDQWAPSWDISWDFEGREQNNKQYYVAQLTEGDEADSLAVIIPPNLAGEWRKKFSKTQGGIEVKITGVLGHRSQVKKEFTDDEIDPKQATDYCIWLKDDDPNHKIEKIGKSAFYSGYLWQCWMPRQWYDGLENNEAIELDQVYMVWEHTNLAAREALNYNLSSLNQKVSQIKKMYRKEGGLILLQKSHGVLVPGEPEWSVKDFYDRLIHSKYLD